MIDSIFGIVVAGKHVGNDFLGYASPLLKANQLFWRTFQIFVKLNDILPYQELRIETESKNAMAKE